MRGRTLLAMLAGTAAIAVITFAMWLMRDPLPRFAKRRSALASVQVHEPTDVGGSRFQSARVTATSGLAVSLITRRQLADSGRRLPLVLVLGGHVTGAEAVKLLGETPGLVIAAMSYPFDGDHRPGKVTFLRQLPSMRRALYDTPPALSLALDHLTALPDVDTSRIEALGVSLGAPFVTIAGALDKRITRVWAIHGSGGTYAPIEMNLRRTIGFAPLRMLAAGIATVIIGGRSLAPERWAGRIAPRPFVMVNALSDERMPRNKVDALYASAGQPKEMIWMSGGHIHADQPTIQRLVRVVLDRIAATAPISVGADAP